MYTKCSGMNLPVKRWDWSLIYSVIHIFIYFFQPITIESTHKCQFLCLGKFLGPSIHILERSLSTLKNCKKSTCKEAYTVWAPSLLGINSYKVHCLMWSVLFVAAELFCLAQRTSITIADINNTLWSKYTARVVIHCRYYRVDIKMCSDQSEMIYRNIYSPWYWRDVTVIYFFLSACT